MKKNCKKHKSKATTSGFFDNPKVKKFMKKYKKDIMKKSRYLSKLEREARKKRRVYLLPMEFKATYSSKDFNEGLVSGRGHKIIQDAIKRGKKKRGK
jgi:hypothetical protein